MLYWTLGMRRPLVVRDVVATRRLQAADVEVTVAHHTIEMADIVPAGQRSVPGAFPYQDLHLVRLTESATLNEVAEWTVGAFEAAAPAPVLGSAHAAPAGRTAYVTADLEAGRYAWISDATAVKGMVKTLIVE